jgi:hypothetical protein
MFRAQADQASENGADRRRLAFIAGHLRPWRKAMKATLDVVIFLLSGIAFSALTVGGAIVGICAAAGGSCWWWLRRRGRGRQP